MLLTVFCGGAFGLEHCHPADELPERGLGGVPACELLVNTMASANHIATGHSAQIYSVIETGGNNGMVTLDQSLERLVRSRAVTLRTALGIARYPAQLKQRLGVL